MTEEQLLEILRVSKEKQIPEKEACKEIMGKYYTLSYYKKKFGIELNKIGKADFTHRTERIHTINDLFFLELNQINCYYGGFIAADGNIDQSKSKLTIRLAIKDKQFLKKFITNLESDYNVTYSQNKRFENCSVCIYSKQICNDLEKWFNIIPAKSLIYQPPILQDDLEDCFIMGLIDGDGTIGFTKRKKGTQNSLYISFAGTYDSVNLVKTKFDKILGKSTSKLYQKESQKNFWQYRISDKNAREIFQYYYNKYNYLPTLDRKWSKEIYDYCINWKKQGAPSRRKGVYIFDLSGKLVKYCETLVAAEKFTGTAFSTISRLCKINDNKHMSNGYMFSREEKPFMDAYEASYSINTKYLLNIRNKKQSALDKGEINIEDEA